MEQTSEGSASGTGDGAPGHMQLTVLLLLAAVALYLLVRLLAPFLPALVTSAVLAVLVYPIYRPFETWLLRQRRWGWLANRNVAAFVGTLAIFFLVLIPLVALSLVLIQEIVRSAEWAAREAGRMLGPGGTLRGWMLTVAEYLGVEGYEIRDSVGDQLQDVVTLLTGQTLSFLSGLGGLLLQAGAALFTIYYLLRDASGIVRSLKWLIPLKESHTDRLFRRGHEIIQATVYGDVVVAIVQGSLGGLAFWAVGLPAAALWGTVMGALSLLPVVAATLVWVPGGLYLFFLGQTVEGILLLAFGALVIGTVDNYLRAVLVSERAQLHPLAVFFSVLGGLFLFGAVGLFAGPVLFVVGISLLEMARLALDPDGQLTTVAPPALFTEAPQETEKPTR